MKRQNILFLTHRFPYPPNRGDRIRSYNLLRVLAGQFNVSLACTSDEPVSEEQIRHVMQFCSQLHIAELGTWSRRIRGGLALLGKKSLTEAMFHSPSLKKTIQKWHGQKAFDKLIVFCSSMYPYATSRCFRQTPKTVDLVDVDSEKWKQLATERSFPMSWIYGREADAVHRLETKIGKYSELITLVSDAEAELYRERCRPSSPAIGVSNGVDTNYFGPKTQGSKNTGTSVSNLIFTGVLDYTPNVEGMIWFCKEVMPKLRDHGDFRIRVVGRRPCINVQELQQIDGVEIVGEVPDVRPYLHEADIAISPLHLARGIQNKVLEAMACGLPTVVSPQSAEGIDATSGKEFYIADTPEDWVDTLCRLAASPEQRKLIGKAARMLAEDRYSWSAKLSKFIDTIDKTDSM